MHFILTVEEFVLFNKNACSESLNQKCVVCSSTYSEGTTILQPIRDFSSFCYCCLFLLVFAILLSGIVKYLHAHWVGRLLAVYRWNPKEEVS